MKTKHNFKIRWTQVAKDTFMYGSQVRFHPTETLFKNELMPSGIVIHQWKMMTRFFEENMAPTLPILKKHQPYRFYFDYDVEPQGSVYFQVVFKRRDGTVIDVQMIQGHEGEVELTDGVASYEVQMINAASRMLKFRHMSIEEKASIPSNTTLEIGEMLNPNEAYSKLNVVFVEEKGISQEAVHHIENCMLVRNWEDVPIDTVVTTLMTHVAPYVSRYQFQFIGYHHQSNEMAYLMAIKLDGHAIVTPHQQEALRERYGTIERSVYYPKADVFTSALHVIHPLLNASRHLYALDARWVNGGER